MKFLTDILAKAGLVVDGNTTLFGTLTGTKTVSSGTPYNLTVTQNSTNGGDTGDGAISINHVLSGSGLGTELVTRSFIFGSNNSRTGGSVLSNSRVLYLVSSTQSGTNTTNLDQVYIEGGTMAGTVTYNRGVLVKTMQGTYQAAFVATGLTSANRVHLLLGNYSLPTGAWGIYSGLTDSSYLQGSLLLGSAIDDGLNKLQVTGSAKVTGILTLNSTISNGTFSYTLPSASGTLALTSALSGYVPTSRTLTINGTAYDLSADRSWTITASGTDATKLPLSGGTLTGLLTINANTSARALDIVGRTDGTSLLIFWNNAVSVQNAKLTASSSGLLIDGVTTFANAISGTSATFSGDITTTGSGFQGRYARIFEASAQRGGLYPYNIISGSGTDYSIGLFSESSLWFAAGGGVTKHLNIASTGDAIFSSTVQASGGYYYGQTTNSFVRLDNSVGSQISYNNYGDVIMDSNGLTFKTANGTTTSTRMTITTAGNFDYGGFNVQSSNNATYRQAFYGGLSIMWRNTTDFYFNSNHTFSSTSTNVASYTTVDGIGRMTISGGNLTWETYNGSVTAGTAYGLTSVFSVSKAGVVSGTSFSGAGTGLTGTASSLSIGGNAATATALSSGQSNWSGTGVLGNVVGLLAWKNYSNSHVIFDASASTNPSGGGCSNTNSTAAWTATYPTLMGWNGSTTYGVRVDSARVADSAGSAGSATTATNFNNGTSYSSGGSVYADTLESAVSADWLELVYHGGLGVRIGTGANGSKALYAGSLYDSGNRVYSAANPQVNISGNAATTSQRNFDGSLTSPDFYASGWFRTSGSTAGLYNSTHNTHFYASGTGQWNFATSNNSWIQIALRPAGHDSTVRGYLYADTSNNVGLLTYDGGWALRVDASKNVQIYGTVSATNLSGTNTGDQTNISGNAATASGQQSGANFTVNTGGAGYGLVGNYNPDLHQGFFAMGAAYTLSAAGGLANFYGVSWSYDYSGRQLNTGYNLQHCMAVANAGTVYTVIGLGIWTSGLIRANGNLSAGGTITSGGAISAGGNISGGYILGSYFNSSAGNSENPTIGQIWTQSTGDNYLRKSTPAHLISQLGLVTSGSSPSFSYVYLSVLAGTDYGALMYSNNGSSYTQWRIAGSKNGYGGISDGYSNAHIGMYDSSGNGGVYREINGRWYWYYLVDNVCMGVNTSTTSASYGLYVSGSIYTTGTLTQASDVRKKTDIVTIDNALEKVTQMRGVYFTKIGEEEKGRQTGVIAQEINEILPEIVIHAKDVDEYSVSYGNAIGVLIEAIKELNVKLDEANKQIENLKQ